MVEIIIVCCVWYAIGVASFVFWWTKDWDFTTEEIPGALLLGILGPIAFAVGATIHGGKKTLFRKREDA